MAAENINESEINGLGDSKPSEFSHHYANLEGVRLHYVTMGDGAPVVLLHGWPQTWYEWRRVMPLLADKFSLVAPDMRGLGDSSRPAPATTRKPSPTTSGCSCVSISARALRCRRS